MELNQTQKQIMNSEIANLKAKKDAIDRQRKLYETGADDGTRLNQMLTEFNSALQEVETKWGVNISVDASYKRTVAVKSEISATAVSDDQPFFQRRDITKNQDVEDKKENLKVEEKPNKLPSPPVQQERKTVELQEEKTIYKEVPIEPEEKPKQKDDSLSEIAHALLEQQKDNKAKKNNNRPVDRANTINKREKTKEEKKENFNSGNNLEFELKKAQVDKYRFMKALRNASKIIAKDHTEKNAEGWFRELISDTYTSEYKKEDISNE